MRRFNHGNSGGMGMLDLGGMGDYQIDGDMDGDLDGDDDTGDLIMEGEMLLSGMGSQMISGDYQIDGDSSQVLGDDGMMGLRNPFRRRRRANAMQVALAARRARTGAVVTQLVPQRSRLLPLPITALGVTSAAPVTITASPQVAFRGQRLSIASVIAGFFAITDVKVGKDSQFVAAGSLPASSFSELAVGDNFVLDTCPVGNQIAITVQNLDTSAAHDFRATLFGTSVLLGLKC